VVATYVRRSWAFVVAAPVPQLGGPPGAWPRQNVVPGPTAAAHSSATPRPRVVVARPPTRIGPATRV
jgi:hypothetical protein